MLVRQYFQNFYSIIALVGRAYDREEEVEVPAYEEEGKEVTSRQKILEVAARLIMEKGVRGTSLADIAREAGISKGTLFYHFPSKDELVYEVTVRHFDELIQGFLKGIDYMDGEKPEKIVYEGLNLVLQAKERGKLNLYLLQEAFMGNDELKAKFKETYRDYHNLMRQFLQKLNGKEDEEDQVKAVMLVALLDGLIIQWLMHPEEVRVEKIAGIIARDFLQYACLDKEQ